jgi:Pyruvate/2-oxoacid:ferredoxin oxidoreductase gamma subunit
MSGTVSLPHADRFFEIRLESIGGLGAHAAGQVLATAAVLRMGLNGAHFSSVGSERKGSLVRSFVRLGRVDRPIRTSAPVEAPDAVVVFHAALLHNPATLAGLFLTLASVESRITAAAAVHRTDVFSSAIAGTIPSRSCGSPRLAIASRR